MTAKELVAGEMRKTQQTEKDYMTRAIELARRGEGWCHPNPMVGAVIVKEGRIIGEGYHARCGELHAERNAIAALTESAEGATIYVTLEPCCHHGKTPPCTEAIIASGIRKVVIGSRDPNPKVSGGGVKMLRNAGIEVITDFMREECDALNPVFFHYITTRTPYVVMKYAITADGKIATRTGASQWISGESSRLRVQEMRHACMGIMAGIGTVLADDPMLNCRLEGGRDPVRILCDSQLRIPLTSKICQTAKTHPTIIACALQPEEAGDKAAALQDAGCQVLHVPGNGSAPHPQVDLKALMQRLGEMEIDSILLEGGGTLNAAALEAEIVQEVRVFVAPKIFGGTALSPVGGYGVAHPDKAVGMELISYEPIDADMYLRYRVTYNRI